MSALKPLASGREAEVFLREDGTILKLMRDAAGTGRVQREAAALAALAAQGHRCPAPRGIVTVDGRPGLLMDRVEGGDLLGVLGRHPLSVFKAGAAIARCHADIHACAAPPGLPDLRRELRSRIEVARSLPDELRREVSEILDDLPDGDRLCHGDLHFGNLLGTWSDPTVIDWGTASCGDPAADVARTKLLLGIGEVDPSSPLLIKVLAPVCRGRVVANYLATYRRLSPIDKNRLARWEVVQAAARLAEPIPSEHPRLLALIKRNITRSSVRGCVRYG